MMNFPNDAAHWDSSDWIEWLRRLEQPDRPPCTAASEDPMARAHSVLDAMVHAARSYLKLTGRNLPVYPAIANLYCSIHHAVPPDQSETAKDRATLVKHIPPHSTSQSVTIDTSLPFKRVIIVRIAPDVSIDARVIPRAALPKQSGPKLELHWSDLSEFDRP